jgi:hypothetical protein
MIPNFRDDRERFAHMLHENISPTAPIQSEEHLYGRQKQLQQIEQALYAPGRSIFIYGDRGVGKTSLARTVAHSHQSATHKPVLLACSPDSTFSGIIGKVISALRGTENPKSESTTKVKATLPIKVVPIGFEVEHSRKPGASAAVYELDLNTAVEILLDIGETRQGENTVVVLDEFDRIASDTERTRFADFIKQIGDQQIPVLFIFCGVADSLQKLLGGHESCFRYLEGVELQRLSWEARFEITNNAANALGVTVDERPRLRIAAISDGFPHYIHLISEKLFWHMFNDPAPCTVPSIDHYREAVSEAVMGIEQHLRTTYDRAIATETADYEELLWAMADHRDFIRSSESVYESYAQLFGGVLREGDDEPLLDRTTVTARLNALKGQSRGCILSAVSNRRGWYQFTESIMRGYVRLRAEEQDVELAQDYSGVSGPSINQAYPVRGARRSRRGVTKRDWEKTKTPSGFPSR